jgi:hypothetical protein
MSRQSFYKEITNKGRVHGILFNILPEGMSCDGCFQIMPMEYKLWTFVIDGDGDILHQFCDDCGINVCITGESKMPNNRKFPYKSKEELGSTKELKDGTY